MQRVASLKTHAEQYPRLKALKKELPGVEKKLNEYKTLSDEITKLHKENLEIQNQLDSDAKTFVTRAKSVLSSQKTQLIKAAKTKKEISLRVERAMFAYEAFQNGTNLRLQNFRSTARKDPKILQAALKDFNQVIEPIEMLRKGARNSKNIASFQNAMFIFMI